MVDHRYLLEKKLRYNVRLIISKPGALLNDGYSTSSVRFLWVIVLGEKVDLGFSILEGHSQSEYES